MTLDVTFDPEAEEIVIIVDDHEVVKFDCDQQDVVMPADRKTKLLVDSDADLYSTLENIAKLIYKFQRDR